LWNSIALAFVGFLFVRVLHVMGKLRTSTATNRVSVLESHRGNARQASDRNETGHAPLLVVHPPLLDLLGGPRGHRRERRVEALAMIGGQ
jgi:hypothetical protein